MTHIQKLVLLLFICGCFFHVHLGSSFANNPTAAIKTTSTKTFPIQGIQQNNSISTPVSTNKILNKKDVYSIFTPAIIALFVLFITNIITLWKIRLDTKASLKSQITQEKLFELKERLEKFYNPILALLSTNSDIFQTFGFKSFPEDQFQREEAARVWENLINEVILPNNNEITQIIKHYSHLLHEGDDLKYYLDFLKHSYSYSVFRKERNEIHSKFSFPTGFEANIRKWRDKTLNELKDFEKSIGSYLEK